MKIKQKTHKATAKRFSLTAKGKVIRKKLQNRNNSHLGNMRKAARIAKPGSYVITAPAEVKKIKKLLTH